MRWVVLALHSFTFQLNFSTFCGMRWVAGGWGGFNTGLMRKLGGFSEQKAQVELESGLVYEALP